MLLVFDLAIFTDPQIHWTLLCGRFIGRITRLVRGRWKCRTGKWRTWIYRTWNL